MSMAFRFACLGLVFIVGTGFSAEKSPIGQKIDGFTAQDFRGKERSLTEAKTAKVVVVAFLGTECPLAKLYGSKLASLAKEYEPKGVAFFGIDSNTQDSLAAITAFARTHNIEFPLLKDLGNKIADQFGAQRTPTVYVLDAERVIRYTGRVDDQYGIGFQRDKPNNKDMVNAINELLEGKKVTKAETDVQGCFIGRTREPKANAAVTYTKHIAAILNHRCVECHRTGEIAPFELTNYKQASGWADMIVEVVNDNRMPPWHADPKHGKFVNERRLSDAEKKLLKDWVAAGAPEGDPKDLPKPPVFPETGWQLPRKPDAVVNMRSTPYEVPAEGTVRYQYFIADPGFQDEKWVEAVEVQPGSRAVVHHILVFAVPRNLAGGGAGAIGNGVNGFLAAYVPGLRAVPYPEGMAKKIPAGSRLVFQIHYTPNGSKQQDLSKIGFLFKDPAKVTHEVRTTSAAQQRLSIPPKEENHKVESSRSIGTESQLLTFMPHMHVRGKAFSYEAVYPDGKKEMLLDVPHYDFNWQTAYRLAEPKKLPAGTRIQCVAAFDNSEKNLSNPDPTKTVRWGDQTWNEMMIGYFDIAVVKGKSDPEAPAVEVKFPPGGIAIPDRAKAIFQRYDTNKDGKLDEKEFEALPQALKQVVMTYLRSMPKQ